MLCASAAQFSVDPMTYDISNWGVGRGMNRACVQVAMEMSRKVGGAG